MNSGDLLQADRETSPGAMRAALAPALAQIRGAYLEAARQLAAARDQRRSEFVLVPPHPPRQEPDPKAWRAFVPRPERTPRARHRSGPHPRRLSVARTPKRCGRRP
ncbi:MAG TPA: hypothetical protein VKZ89_20155 [Thermobifida alba]|nr:hypothetical protein [Thermobifida alba]